MRGWPSGGRARAPGPSAALARGECAREVGHSEAKVVAVAGGREDGRSKEGSDGNGALAHGHGGARERARREARKSESECLGGVESVRAARHPLKEDAESRATRGNGGGRVVLAWSPRMHCVEHVACSRVAKVGRDLGQI
jgi:hypothetical protein